MRNWMKERIEETHGPAITVEDFGHKTVVSEDGRVIGELVGDDRFSGRLSPVENGSRIVDVDGGVYDVPAGWRNPLGIGPTLAVYAIEAHVCVRPRIILSNAKRAAS